MEDSRIRGDAGVMAELRNIVRKKTEVEVLPVVDSSEESAFCILLVGDAAQEQRAPLAPNWPHIELPLAQRLLLLGCLRFTKFCSVGKHVPNIT